MGKLKEREIEREDMSSSKSARLTKQATEGDKDAFMELMSDFFDRALDHEDSSFVIHGTNENSDGILTLGAITPVNRARIAVDHITALKEGKLRTATAGFIMTEVLTEEEREQILPVLVVGSLASSLKLDLDSDAKPDDMMQAVFDKLQEEGMVSKDGKINSKHRRVTSDVDLSELDDDEFYS